MAISFDGPNLRIILDTATSVDVQDIYSAWKAWQLTGANIGYPPAFRTVGGDPLTAGITAGAYYFLANSVGWRIRPPEASITIYVAGNLAPEDASLPLLVPTIGNYSVLVAGLQPVTQSVASMAELLEFSSFNGLVHLDVTSPYSGTAFPVGTPIAPVNTLADAKAIAQERGFDAIHVMSDLVIGATDDVRDIKFYDEADVSAMITFTPGCLTDGVAITDCDIEGTLDGGYCYVQHCQVHNLAGFGGVMENSVLQGTVTLASEASFISCMDGVNPGSCVIDFNSVGVKCEVRDYFGGLAIRNKTGAQEFTANFTAGRLKIEATVTGGTIVVRGVGEISENLGSATINDSGLVNAAKFAAVAESPLIRKLLQNKTITNPATGIETIYDDDNATPLVTANLYEDAAGTVPYGASSTRIDRRNRLT